MVIFDLGRLKVNNLTDDEGESNSESSPHQQDGDANDADDMEGTHSDSNKKMVVMMILNQVCLSVDDFVTPLSTPPDTSEMEEMVSTVPSVSESALDSDTLYSRMYDR